MICGEMSMINAAYAALIFSISAAASLTETLMNAHMPTPATAVSAKCAAGRLISLKKGC